MLLAGHCELTIGNGLPNTTNPRIIFQHRCLCISKMLRSVCLFQIDALRPAAGQPRPVSSLHANHTGRHTASFQGEVKFSGP